jgi:hypothetical protein
MDLEGFFNQELYLNGNSYSLSTVNLLNDETLTMGNSIKILELVEVYIDFYGLDFWMLEKANGNGKSLHSFTLNSTKFIGT